MKTLRESFDNSKYLSVKQDSYFDAYDKVLNRFVGKPVTVVEVGVLNGGSLFMWRDYFGENANIIGVEFNPSAKKWEEHGFRIFTGDQASEEFWDNFFKEVGPVDILIDDGGHTNHQQIVTVQKAVHHIRDGGLLIVEDTHASYMKSFGNPSPYSFIAFAKSIIDRIHGRYTGNTRGTKPPARQIHSVEFFESMTVFSIDRRKTKMSEIVRNGGISSNAVDYRFKKNAAERLSEKVESSKGLVRNIYKKLLKREMRRQNSSLKKYFTNIDV
ncbi:hypothetical protein GCM10007874_24860 [Labrys miyagiensis]|uniref:Methyltransferase domain-containing protein n=1 Tax=Labrys miyagiensis TaxID=346912 RepID=A0ABQ6CL65_9HYPH|nr:class I SAM-dependent methyltransferase [Labrys miyagiensis]GLS19469.1 hypothetical protein GCM10007874_24860 [Labrys miyagiensis]